MTANSKAPFKLNFTSELSSSIVFIAPVIIIGISVKPLNSKERTNAVSARVSVP